MTKTQLLLSIGSGPTFTRYALGYGDLTTAGTTQQITLDTLPANSVVVGVRIQHTASFAGGTINAMTVSVDSAAGGVAFFASAFNVFQAAAVTTLQCTNEFKAATSAADTLACTFTSGVGNVNAATAGAVYIDVAILKVTGPTS
jgi:hypothetical protein